jgi:coproporphyrinogen III oxidase
VKSILSSMPPSTSWTYEMPNELKKYEIRLLKALKESWVI